MTDPYAPLWREAAPYLRTRKGDVHVPLAYDYAEQLLERIPEADRDIVLPAILLHDIGWALVDQDIFRGAFFADRGASVDTLILHEREGAREAREILERHGYPPRVVDPVTAIIDGHDSRPEPISRDDAVVKDADKLWRFSVTGVGIACDWFGMTPAAYADLGERDYLPRLFTPAAIELARAELERTRRLLRLDLLTGDPA